MNEQDDSGRAQRRKPPNSETARRRRGAPKPTLEEALTEADGVIAEWEARQDRAHPAQRWKKVQHRTASGKHIDVESLDLRHSIRR